MSENPVLHEVFQLPKLKSALGRTNAVAEELAKQVQDGLRQPLGFPGFGKFLFSGDRIVVAVHSGVSEIELVLNPLLDELFNAGGLGMKQVSLLFADRESAERFKTHGAPRDKAAVSVVHEGTSDHALALLGADDGNFPILVNRLIFDSDVLIPIIRASDEPHSMRRPMIWDFVDSATKKRWRSQMLKHDEAYGNHISELAGVMIVVDVVLGPGDFPYYVVVGRSAEADETALERLATTWQIRSPAQADIVIATVDDRRDRRSWQAVRDAIVSAAELGQICPIVILSDIDEPPPNELRGIFSSHTAAGRVKNNFDPTLRSAIERRTIYLSSKLDAKVVHDLGMKFIAGAEEVRSLVTQFEHPVLLRDGQRGRREQAEALSEKVKPTKVRFGVSGTHAPSRRPRGGGMVTRKGSNPSPKPPAKKAKQTRRRSV